MNEAPELTNKEYKFVCEMIWGGVPFAYSKNNKPITKEMNMESPLFKEMAPIFLSKYPKLDKDL